jgi:hypothetical protein
MMKEVKEESGMPKIVEEMTRYKLVDLLVINDSGDGGTFFGDN